MKKVDGGVSVKEWLESMKRACVYKHVLRMCAYTMLIELLLHNHVQIHSI